MRELRKLWWLLDTSDITLRARYIRSAANVWADRLSRERDPSDWSLDRGDIDAAQRAWGLCSVDRFASANNALLPRFNSLLHDPRAEAVDAMAQSDESWARERNWCHPPWHMLGDVAAKLRASGAAAIVVAPSWRSESWYQELLELSAAVRVLPSQVAPPRSRFAPPPRGTGVRRGWSATLFHVEGRPLGRTPAPALPTASRRAAPLARAPLWRPRAPLCPP
jgi:hypothetical protein